MAAPHGDATFWYHCYEASESRRLKAELELRDLQSAMNQMNAHFADERKLRLRCQEEAIFWRAEADKWRRAAFPPKPVCLGLPSLAPAAALDYDADA